jgi:hypothetical protein
MAASPEDQARTMIANLKEKTGHSLEGWLGLLRGREGDKHGQIVKALKQEHGVTHGFANLIAHSVRTGAAADGPGASFDDPVAAQYEGKESLRPIYDALITFVSSLGDDVEIAPKKSYVSLRRDRQFGLVQASTKSRVDLGLRLDGVEPDGRLEASGSFNSMASHRVRLSTLDGFDEQVRGWLEVAYRDA